MAPAELRGRVAAHVSELRRARGLSQERLAEAAGLATRTVQSAEAGRLNATLATLARLARGLGVDPVTLLVPR